MSGPFQPDRIPEPRWLRFGPDDPEEPPEKYLPTSSRKALRELGEEWLDPVDIDALYKKGLAEAGDTPEVEAVEKAYKVWQEANTALRDAVLDLYDESVGDDWNERE